MTEEEKEKLLFEYSIKKCSECQAINILKAQVEKMKCCGNCKYKDRPFVFDKEDGRIKKIYCKDCIKKNKWELAE